MLAANAGLHREEIKAKLRMKFGTIEAFEQLRELPPRSVKDVLRGRSVRRTAEAIAFELGVPIQAVLSRYEDHPSPNGDCNDNKAETHRQSARAP